MSILTGQMPKP